MTKITITCATEGAKIYYTLDGSDPSIESTLYSEPIIVGETTVIKAIAVKDGLKDSLIAEKEVVITALATVDMPELIVEIGENLDSATVVISNVGSYAEGTVFYYTEDGSVPTVDSATTEGSIVVTANETVSVMAVYDDVASAVASIAVEGLTVQTPEIDDEGEAPVVETASVEEAEPEVVGEEVAEVVEEPVEEVVEEVAEAPVEEVSEEAPAEEAETVESVSASKMDPITVEIPTEEEAVEETEEAETEEAPVEGEVAEEVQE